MAEGEELGSNILRAPGKPAGGSRCKFWHVEDLANHDDPESCTGIREGAGEALIGEHAGRVLSRGAPGDRQEVDGASPSQ